MTRNKWKASMPKERAPAGRAHVVLAYKDDANARLEFNVNLKREQAVRLMDFAIELSKEK
jgi:hypothetical protein